MKNKYYIYKYIIIVRKSIIETILAQFLTRPVHPMETIMRMTISFTRDTLFSTALGRTRDARYKRPTRLIPCANAIT